jgi:hypothetical protein
LYKCAGNSIVVNVLEAIFKNIFKDLTWPIYANGVIPTYSKSYC